MTTVSHDLKSEIAHVYFRGTHIMMTRLEMIELRDTLANTLMGWGEPCACSNHAPTYNRRGQYEPNENS